MRYVSGGTWACNTGSGGGAIPAERSASWPGKLTKLLDYGLPSTSTRETFASHPSPRSIMNQIPLRIARLTLLLVFVSSASVRTVLSSTRLGVSLTSVIVIA